jgi:GH25 family lysozyme M1 (1,4-beta-N-acetylmuramidase)
MMPPDSPDAQDDPGPGLAAGTQAGSQPGTQAAAGQLLGIDVSHHQPSINWGQVAASGVSFAFMKATEGVGYTDPNFQQNLTGASAAGLVVGAYTYAHPETDPTQQADYFADAMGVLPRGSLPPVLDLEATGGLSVAQLVTWTQTFLDRLEYRTGIVPMIYTGPNFWQTRLGNSTAFARYPLWEAHYTSLPAPYQIGGWSTYDVWQYTSSGTVGGIAGSVDLDRFNGSIDDLRALATSSGMPAIAARAADPATQAWIGAPTTGIFCGLRGGGCGQQFASASIYWSPGTGQHLVQGGIRGLWAASGWEWNFGYPANEMVCGLRDGGCGQAFSGNVSVYWSAASGVHEVRDWILSAWARAGAEQSGLGYPTTGQFCGLPGGGCGQQFQGGSIYWSPAAGVHVVTGAIRALWAASGWERNFGYPANEMGCTLRDGGCGQAFTNDVSVYWSPGSGVHEVRDWILGSWAWAGAEQGALAYPTTGQICGLRSGGCGQHFQGGSIYWTSRTGAWVVMGAIRYVWANSGWENGRYGYPLGNAYLSGGYYYQKFQGGTIKVRG